MNTPEARLDIWVTGASSGIGKALVAYWLERGHRVFASSRSIETTAQAENAHPFLVAVNCDVSDQASVNRAISRIRQHTEKLDMLICSAGICHYFDHGKIEPALALDIVQTNLMGTIYCINAALPLLEKSTNQPLIAGVSSLSADVPFPRASVYGASKAAVNYFLRSLRSDLHDSRVRVAIVHPGFIATPMTDRNDFAMPFLMTADKAATLIGEGLARGKKEIRFPFALALLTRLAGCLPESIRMKLAPSFTRQEQA